MSTPVGQTTTPPPPASPHRSRRINYRRALIPALIVLFGLFVVLPVAGNLGGKLSSVTENDQAAFLPDSAESTRSLALETRFAGTQDIPALVVWERASGLTPADLAAVTSAVSRLSAVEGVSGDAIGPIPSQDGKAVQVVVPLPADNSAFEELPGVVENLTEAAQVEGLPTYVTGPGGQFADFAAAFEGIDGRLLFTTVGVVLVILLLIYRSPVFLPVLVSAGLALLLAQAIVYLAAKSGTLTVDGQSQGILSVLVLGAGTDYALLLISRFKEELHREDQWSRAMRTALRGAVPPILASGATVILGLLCLLLSDLNSNKSLGPVGAIGIAASVLAMTVFLPALLLVFGRYWFWPFVPRHDEQPPVERGVWWRVANLVGRRARAVAALTTLGLLAAAMFTTTLEAEGLTTAEQFTTEVDSVQGQEVLARHFPAGTGVPTSVIGKQADATRLLDVVTSTEGVASARLVTDTPPGQPPAPDAPPAEPKVVDGQVQVEALLAASADSPEAEETVQRLRTSVDAVGTDVLVGGGTAVVYDIKVESARDNRVIIPAILVVILLVLAVLLRSILAPLLLVATVVLSFFATLGVCALVFEYVFGFAGADPSFPLFAFVFLVALGIDYNIFLMTRVREESIRHGTRAGTLRGLAVTGGVITSAGVVLAATFAALGVLPLVPFAQLGFAVAFGVLLDTLIVRSLLVPALVHLLGDKVWWPVGLRREQASEPQPVSAAAAH